MNRLTETFEKFKGLSYKEIAGCNDCNNCLGCMLHDKIVEKLAAYEDIGLEPKDILSNIKTISNEFNNAFEKLQEYKNLEEQGLLIKLPCKVGDTVFKTGLKNKIYSFKVLHISLSKYGTSIYAVGVDKGGYQFKLSDFGKSAFLTREEAENKLKKMEA